ncbi:putative HTH-type transcriptional regulator [bioreactor metagenome]|uniref:Putative HTH-type transcriptional regulator n=1 Tax=bioreactor metagenome TaxID=1076179 RepID=A0A645G8L4_9ZZZZ
MKYSIGEFSRRTGLSIHTLRYYEKEKLIFAGRDEKGRRRYSEGDIAWIDFILRLKETGMPIRDIRRYAELRYQGDATMPERLRMLQKHRETIRGEIKKWETNLANMDRKIKTYEEGIAKIRVLYKAAK